VRNVELVVVGAGPAGIAAARAAAKRGIQTVLVDENPPDPANIRRNIPLWYGSRSAGRAKAADLFGWLSAHPHLEQAVDDGVELLAGHSVWGLFPDRSVALFDGGSTSLLKAGRVILATGATDLHLAFPGWTLGGVLGARGALHLLETYGYLEARRMVVLGSGNLALEVARRARTHGIEVMGIVEIGSEVTGDPSLAFSLSQAGVAFFFQHTLRAAQGGADLERVILAQVHGDQVRDDADIVIQADTLCVAIGCQPAIELAYLASCELEFDANRGGYFPRHDAYQRTTQHGMLVAGDAAGFDDAAFLDPSLAEQSGERAALAAAGAFEAPLILPTSKRAYFTRWHQLADSISTDDVIVCRCEEITRGQVLRALDELGTSDPDEVKRISRAGMGLCQGRGCRPIVAGLLASRTDHGIADVPLASYRPPVRPLPLSALATEESHATAWTGPFDAAEARLTQAARDGQLRPLALSRFRRAAEEAAFRAARDGLDPLAVALELEEQTRQSEQRA
jgi:NADPH-dependent 2,4-dienoyl-CoA reductase/sulfur reductase-like enzyme